MKYQEWHKDCIELSEKGLSGRKIAKHLGMGKTQINDVLKAFREGTLELLEPEIKKPKILYFDLHFLLIKMINSITIPFKIPSVSLSNYSIVAVISYILRGGT